jgi:hypothetical protein
MHYWKGSKAGSTIIIAGSFGLKRGRITRVGSSITPFYFKFEGMTQIGPSWTALPTTDPGTDEGPAYLYGCFAEFKDRLYYCNGVDWPIRIDGLHHLFAKSTFQHSGRAGPVYSAMGVFHPELDSDDTHLYSSRTHYDGLRADTSFVNVDGLSTYAASVNSKYGESPAVLLSPPKFLYTPTALGTLTVFRVLDWSNYADYITEVKFYRLPKNGTVCQYVGKISRGDYSFMDTLCDGELGYAVPFDTGLPQPFRLLVTYENRMFGVGGYGNPNRVACSKAGYPDVWPALYELSLSANLGNRTITQAKVLNGSLYLFLDEGILRMYGSSPENYGFSVVSDFVGCVAPKTMLPHSDGVVFLSKDGLYFFNGSQLRKITDNLFGVLDGTLPGSMGWHRACGAVSRKYYYISYRDDSGRKYGGEAGSNPNRTYKINMDTGTVGVVDDWAFNLSTPCEGTESLVIGHQDLD